MLREEKELAKSGKYFGKICYTATLVTPVRYFVNALSRGMATAAEPRLTFDLSTYEIVEKSIGT